MLRNLIIWLSVYVLSFLVSLTGLVSQSTAFVWIYSGAIPFVLIFIVLASFPGTTNKIMGVVLILVAMIFILFVPFGISWLVSRIFGLKFALAFEILTFITCFFYTEPKQ